MKNRVTHLLSIKSKFNLFVVLFIASMMTTPIFTKEIKPLGLFEDLVGNWRIKDYSLDAKGEWQPAGGADWNFYTVLNITLLCVRESAEECRIEFAKHIRTSP